MVRAVWNPRGEGWVDAIPRLHAFLMDLASLSDRLAHWCVPRGTRKQSVDTEVGALTAAAEAGRLVPDGGVLPDDLGTHLSLFSGPPQLRSSVYLRVIIGVLDNPSGFRNSVHIAIPRNEASLRTPAAVGGIVDASVRAWAPEWACVYSESHAREASNFAGVFAGWMIWLRHMAAARISLPAGVDVREHLGGVLITTVAGNFDDTNPQQIELSNRVQDALVAARVIPIPE